MSEQQTETDELFTPEEFVQWVEQLVSRVESVDMNQAMRWCPQWWAHTEAVDRFKALYQEWLLRQAEGGMSSWWTDHFDRHAAVLFTKRGPFGECGTSHVEKSFRRILACEQPPADWIW
ncbi:DUF4913 domain-containing protein [Kocuria oceani]|uniref:DUF4913 domain-containing protein n=1 Tax=Kocuria oceani TaxID=988827 RepID=A0ABV9TL35_9MICC|nr:DUF4913 domain-containing protein [Kocuria oceani]